MRADPFSEILSYTRAESVVTGGFTAGGPWAIRFPAPDKIKFFAVMRGFCWVHIDGHAEPVHFGTGDVGLLTAKRSFVLASDLTVEPLDAMSLFGGNASNRAQLGDGEDFCHIGGHVLLDTTSGGLLADVLPPWIRVPATSPHAQAFSWLLDSLINERATEQPGAQLVSAQLAQLLFIQILRAHLQSGDAMPPSWMGALSDKRLAPALQLMHEDPARSWGLETLAKACAMSRTTFVERFRTVVGVTPITYLTQWRMRLAERTLRQEDSPIAAIAEQVGYASESAFSNAFKRLTGRSPRSYRNNAREAGG
ncbi:AraC family transcriptional regulator [Pseudomonas sp. NPDC088368]|jgi:AraC-like DNA-binding protein|uniref:AraC family transcriptional regulator n=1 Tax=Pseudomonas sp. NPDC088368 TaxID=3364453 RepID=UPI00382E3B3A